MIKDITVAKEEMKKNGMTVDGRGYQISFTGLICVSLIFPLLQKLPVGNKIVRLRDVLKKWKLTIKLCNVVEN